MSRHLVVLGGELLLPDGGVLTVHRAADCLTAPCVIHAPTDHHMRGWPIRWRADRTPGFFERQCRHRVWHPDPDQFAYWRLRDLGHLAVHGCDRCCRPPELTGGRDDR